MRSILIIVLFFSFVLGAYSQPVQWRGPNRDGQFPETGLLKEWPENGPEQILEVNDLGKGWSSPIYADGMIYITGMIDTLDYLSAVDMQGNIKWQVPYGRSWTKTYPDTRASATVDGNRIYVQSGTGRLVCIDSETGKENWAVEVDKDFECEYHEWGNSETPLVVDDKVICTPGGEKTSVVAFNKMTGELIWQSKSVGGPRSYVSPAIYEFNGHRYLIAATASNLIALEPETGKVDWTYQYWKPVEWKWQVNGLIWANTPVFKDNEIFISMGYDYPAVMLSMDSTGNSVSEKYIDHTLDNHIGGLVQYDGYVYGSNWYSNSTGRWVCMKWDSGEIKYVADWDTKGPVVMAEGMLYCYNERGNVALVKPDPKGFDIVSQFKIKKGSGPHWAHPFIADGKLFMRHGEVMMVFDIKAK